MAFKVNSNYSANSENELCKHDTSPGQAFIVFNENFGDEYTCIDADRSGAENGHKVFR